MSDATKTAEAYYAAWGAGDFDGLRRLLTDDFTARGPQGDFAEPDAFVASCRAMGARLGDTRLEMVDRAVIDGGDGRVVHTYAFRRGDKDAPVAECFTVREDKIAALRIYQDPARFMAVWRVRSPTVPRTP